MTDGACEFPKMNSTAEEISVILKTSKTIAVVGFSPKPERPSHGIYFYLKSQGYQVFAVNPAFDTVDNEKVYRSLSDIPFQIDIVDIFRNPDAVPGIVDESIKIKAKVIWMQEGIVHNQAAEKARVNGLQVVMNKCILKEHRGL